jgi:hypothetical protein
MENGMNVSEFKQRLEVIRLSDGDKRQISDLITNVDDDVLLEGVVSCVQAHVADDGSIPFLASLVVRAGTQLDKTLALELSRHLRSNSSLEDSELYEALRDAYRGQ